MPNYTIADIKKVRDSTDCTVMAARKALDQTNGNIDSACEITKAQTDDGSSSLLRTVYVDSEGVVKFGTTGLSSGTMVEFNCETDFASKDKSFLDFAETVLGVALKEIDSDLAALRKKLQPQTEELMSRLEEKVSIHRVDVVKGDTVVGYLHGSSLGVLVAGMDGGIQVFEQIAMHVASIKPTCLRPQDVPADQRAD